MKVFVAIKKDAPIIGTLLSIDNLPGYRLGVDELQVEIDPKMPRGAYMPLDGRIGFIFSSGIDPAFVERRIFQL